MLIKTKLKLKILVQVGLVALFHLILIYFSDIGIKETLGMKNVLIVYFSPILLLCTTCAMSLKVSRYRYNLLWMSLSTLPSIVILHYLNQMHKNKVTVAGFIDLTYFDLKIDYGQISLLFYFPLIFSIIQIILMLILWVKRTTM